MEVLTKRQLLTKRELIRPFSRPKTQTQIGLLNDKNAEPVSITENAKQFQAICLWFTCWQTWQQKMLFSGIVSRLSKAQLRSLGMIVESMFHRDFLAMQNDVYPTRKLKPSIKSIQILDDEPITPVTSCGGKTSPIKQLSLMIDYSESKFLSEAESTEGLLQAKLQRRSQTPEKKSDTPDSNATHDSRISHDSHVTPDSRVAMESPASGSSTNRSHSITPDGDAKPSSARILSPIVETLLAEAEVLSSGSSHLSSQPSSTSMPSIHSSLNSSENRHSFNASNCSVHSVAPSLSPIAETSGESISPPKSGASDASQRTSLVSPGEESPTPKNINKPKDKKEAKDLKASNFKSKKITHVDSKASLWTMGPSESGETRSEYCSRVTPVRVDPGDFFTENSKQTMLGAYVTSRSRANSGYLRKIDLDRNKVPIPAATQLFKHAKLWSHDRTVIAAKTTKLKDDFRKQLTQIWTWAERWEEHIFVQLLLKLFDQCEPSLAKYAGECIRKNITAVKVLEDSAEQFLPDSFWMGVFDHLGWEDLITVGKVCKKWGNLINNDALWKTKCEELGMQFGIPNVIKLVEGTARPNETLDWKQAYLELHERFVSNAERLAAFQHRDSPVEEDAASSEDDNFFALVNRYKGYKSFGKMNASEDGPKKKMDPPKTRLTKNSFGEDVVDGEGAAETPGKSPAPKGDPQGKAPEGGGGPGGFLQMWKNITEELPENDAAVTSKRSDRCYDAEIWDELFSEDELNQMCASNQLFAVDHRLPQNDRSRFWLVNNTIMPITRVQLLDGHRGSVTSVLCHGKRIFSGGLDRRIRIWAESGESFAKLEDCLKGSVVCMAIGADEKCRTLYSSSWDTTVSVWDTVSCKRTNELSGHTDTVSAVAVDGKYIISTSHDCTIRVWNISTYRCMRVLRHHEAAIECLSYEDRLIITGGADKMIHFADPDTGYLIRTFKGHTYPVTAIKRQRDLVASGDMGGCVFFWSMQGDNEKMESIQAHSKEINAIDFHGGRFFTASGDMLVKEWELMTMTCVRVIQGHVGAVTGVQYTSKYLATCSKDGTVRLWWWGTDEDVTDTEEDDENDNKKDNLSLTKIT